MIISSRTGPGAFSRDSFSSVAGSRADQRDDSSGRCGGASVMSGDCEQASPGSRAAAGVAAGPQLLEMDSPPKLEWCPGQTLH